MESVEIITQYSVIDERTNVAYVLIKCTPIHEAKRIVIKDAYSDKNTSLFIIFNSLKASTLTIKNGDAHQPRMADLHIGLGEGVSTIPVSELSKYKFMQKDGSIVFETDEDFVGTVFAIGDWKEEEEDDEE